MSWGRRVLFAPGLLYLDAQRLLLRLLADHPDESRLPAVVVAIGGTKQLFWRFFEHYKVIEE